MVRTLQNWCSAAAIALAGGVAAHATADVIYETEDPFGGFFGILGFDVSNEQSVGHRFTPAADYTLDTVSVWFMNNDASGEHFGEVVLTLRDDKESGTGGSIPGDTIYETWTFNVTAVGWDPVLEVFDSVDHPVLEAGVNYWIVAESNDDPLINPVWCMAQPGNGFMSFSRFGEWQDGGDGGDSAMIIEGSIIQAEYVLDISDPVFGGEDMTFTVSEARPNATTWVAYSLRGEGSTPIPQLGIVLGLDRPKQAGDPVRTDGSGSARWNLFVPPAGSGHQVWFQSAQRGAVSNVVTTVIQ